ncbi:MAG: SDR family oxidoreductase [Patescibacteria group bacterium]
MSQSLILGGTKGLGRELATQSIQRGFDTIVVGRSAAGLAADPEFKDADMRVADLSNPYAFGKIVEPADCYKHVFLVAGTFQTKPLMDTTPEESLALARIHLLGPVETLKSIHRMMLTQPPHSAPYHLVVISSTSSYRIRENEEMYCALQAAKAHFTRNWAPQILKDLPGSRVTLVLPAGIKTELYQGTGQDTSDYMEPAVVAEVIWNFVLKQTEEFQELKIERNGSQPVISIGSTAPHNPHFR